MKLFSYVVARDYGFAPNPFGNFCTLATCKPGIRKAANPGDYVVGITSKRDSKISKILYVMRVDEVSTYNAYWTDSRFEYKKPIRTGAVKQLFGDNIYHQEANGHWIQIDSHHSLEDGSPNELNIENDTKSEGVLISQNFTYWGNKAIEIPTEFLDFQGETLVLQRGFKNNFSDEFVKQFVNWFETSNARGFLGAPFMWHRKNSKWSRPRG